MKKFTLGITLVTVLLFAFNTAMAQTPEVSGLSIDASSPGDLTNDNLESDYTVSGSVVETAESWHVDGSPITTLILPMEGGGLNALLDFSGEGNNATLSTDGTRQPVWDADTGYNTTGAFAFDGNDYLEAGNVLPIGASYTKTAWVMVTGGVGTFRNIMSADFYGESNHFLKLGTDGCLTAGHRFGDPVVEDNDSLDHDTWYFAAVTFDYETGEMVLYLNGNEEDTDYVPVANRDVADPAMLIGSMAHDVHWVGVIDHPTVYDRALSEEQIMSLYTDGVGLLLAEETRGGESWHVEVTPFSTSEVGDTEVSNIIDIVGPSLSGLELESFSTNDLSIDDLTASYTVNSPVVGTATAWFKNGDPDAIMYLPFEGGLHNALLDFSGNDNHAVFNDALSSSRPEFQAEEGIDGSGAYYFDGYHDHLIAGDVLPLNADYTKTAWIYVTGGAGDFRNIISSDFYGPNNHYLKVTDGGQLSAGQNTGLLTVLDPAVLAEDTWYHTAVTFDYETGDMILYKDGAVVSTATLPPAERSVADPTVLIGSMAYSVEFRGRIDDPTIYGRVVTPEQIEELYDNGRNTMLAEETHGTDVWHVEATPFANFEVGTTRTSNSIRIYSTIVSTIPDESITEGSSFSPIDLDDYVLDHEYADDQISWATHGETDLTVTISGSRVATISTPNADWFGTEDVYFVATNPFGDADSTEVSFTVTNTNDAPVLTDILDQVTIEDVNLVGLPVAFTDPDGGDTHTITVVSSDPDVTMDNLSGHVSGSTYDLVPALNWNGTADITVTVTDDGTGTLFDSETYTLTVDPVNDAPVISEIGDQVTTEDVPLTMREVLFTDPDDGDLHTINVVSDEADVSVENLTGNVNGSTYDLVPAADWNGTAEITVYVTDNGTGTLSDTEVYTLTVSPVNDAPVLTELGDQSTDEDVDLTDLSVDFSDPDASDTHTITVVSGNVNVTVAGLSGHTTGSTYDLVLADNWNGTASITVTVTENGTGGLSDSEVYTLTVDAINDAPVLTEVGDLSVNEDNVLSGIAVVFTDAEPSDMHNITVVSDNPDVTVANLSGSVSGSTYTLIPAADWNGTAQIIVTVTETGSSALFDQEIYTLTVNSINDAPASVALSEDEVEERVPIGTAVGMFSSVDVDSDTHTYTFTTDGGVFDVDNASFTIVDGTLQTAAELDFEVQSTYTILVLSDDGSGGTLSQNFTITVLDVDETSVEDIYNNPAFNIYPIPAIEYVTVEVDNPENKELLLEIYYATGAIVHSEPIFDKKRIDLTGFKDGMYVVRVSGDKVYGTRKLIVKDR